MTKLEVTLQSIEDLKLTDIYIYNMKERSPFFDHVILATASNKRQLKACAKRIKDDIAQHHQAMVRSEGDDEADWILVDVGEVVVNLFTESERAFYNLEKLWPDVPCDRRENGSV
jgi:ribosome-associated protein